MKLRVLGCSGGIGGQRLRTTTFAVDDDILIDCGTGACDLDFEALRRIDYVFLTHSHLDHIASLPLLVDSVGDTRGYPLTVFALPETLRILRSHIFNWLVWPDFTAIPDRAHPFLRMQPLMVGETVRLGERAITALPAHHTVPSCGYCLDSGHGQLAFSGDSGYSAEFIAAVNALPSLRHLIIETAFADQQRGLAIASRHLCPDMLGAILEEFRCDAQVHITHLKPGLEAIILEQIGRLEGGRRPRALVQSEVLEF